MLFLSDTQTHFIRRNFIWLLIAVLSAAGLISWLFFESYNLNKPKPGIETSQPGNGHLPQGQKLDFKFNPPTSGDHYAAWITKGFYDEPRTDGNIVHSLEHGYVVVNYDCEQKLSRGFNLIQSVSAQESATEEANSTTPPSQGESERAAMTDGSQGVPSIKLADMPEAFRDGSCDNLKNQLKALYDEFGQHKLIFQPWLKMDAPIVITAWGRTLKLTSVDKTQMKQFIDAFRDRGPERTIEP